MSLRINIRNTFQYFTIYAMLIVNQSNLYKYFLSNYNYVIVVGVLLVMVILARKDVYIIGFMLFLMAQIIFTRVVIGDVGLSAWVNWAIKIGCCHIAISINKESFFDRFISVIRFLAICSIIGYVIGIVAPGFFTSGFFTKYSTLFVSERTWTSQTSYIAEYFNSYGLFLYSYTEHESLRNIGIFTEPGIYQMVLNAGIFILLFYTDKLKKWDERKRTSTLMVLIIALLLCQSATGYIGVITIFIVYCIDRNKGNSRMKHRMILLAGLMTIVIAADYLARGNESFLGTTILRKLFNETGSFDIMADTGAYRYGMIIVALQSMILHPLGVGYDAFRFQADSESTGFVAAQILQTGAVYGVIMLLAIIAWATYPIIRYEKKKKCAFLIVFLYFNTALAQSSEFYPVLIMFGMYLMMFRPKAVEDENKIYA